ncbi:MAG: hypothetical protein ACLQIQ_21950 [Beijerinckiaceae bacterium]
MSVTFETRSVGAAAIPSKSHRRAKSTIAISAALLVTSSFIGLALLIERPLERPARPPAGLELRKSLVPPEFSCPSENCAERPAAVPGEPLHGP